MSITQGTTLRELAFIVGDALFRAGTIAILSGGGAATVYAPEAYQSRDLDFILGFWSAIGGASNDPLLELGFIQKGGLYAHPGTVFTVEFPPGPLAIGEELISDWTTLVESGRTLQILSPTDCIRDRLAWYVYSNDYSALEQAVKVAAALREEVDFESVSRWCEREGGLAKAKAFDTRLSREL